MLLVIIVAPLLLFPGGWRTWGLLLPIILLAGNRLFTRRWLTRTPYDLAILVLLAMVLVSLYATFSISFSLPKIAGVVLGVTLLYASVGFLTEERRFRWGMAGVSLGITGFAAVALFGSQWGTKLPIVREIAAQLPRLIEGLPGAESGFHPAEVGGTLCWILFIPAAVAIGLLKMPTSPWRKLLAIPLALLSALLAAMLILTTSRSAWIGVGVATAIALALISRWSRALVVGGLVALAIVAFWLRPVDFSTILGDESPVDLGTVTNINIEGRIEIWSRAIYGIQDFPFTGMGMGTFRKVVHILYPLFLVPPEQDLGHAHNEALQAALDLGIPGLIAFLALQILAIAAAYLAWRHGRDPLIRWASLGTLAGLIAHDVYGLTDAVALGAKPGAFWWLLLALGAAAWQLTVRESEADTNADHTGMQRLSRSRG